MKETFDKFIKKIKKYIDLLWDILKPYKKNIIIPLLKILGVIIVCAILVRLVSGHETLADYAAKNPDIAYGIEK